MMNNETVSLSFEGVVKNYNALVQLVNENFDLKALLGEYKQLVAELKQEKEVEEVAANGEHKQPRKR